MKTFKLNFLVLSVLLILNSCQNGQESIGSKEYSLSEIGELTIPLDSMSPPKPPFVQFLEDEDMLTFFNPFNYRIYRYNLSKRSYEMSINIQWEGQHGVNRPVGYHIINADSIFIFDMGRNELVLVDSIGKKKSSISLINNMNMRNADWALSFPQFFPKTSTPILGVGKQLIMTGFYAWAIPDTILNTFKFTGVYDVATQSLDYHHSYPKKLYGSKFNWDDPIYTTVYYDWNIDKKVMVYSFPVSESLFEGNLLGGELTEKKGMKDVEQVLKPMRYGNGDRQAMLKHLIESDIYATIKYDKFKKLYYRILLEGIPYQKEMKELIAKPVSVQVIDSEGIVLHKERIGLLGNWNYENVFVTKEGLFIEYLESKVDHEDFLIFKLFNLKKI